MILNYDLPKLESELLSFQLDSKQKEVLESALNYIKSNIKINSDTKHLCISGRAGTGKTQICALIVKILKEQGVPEDLVYLAAIESHYDNAAVSSAKAVGMWQFMPSTAKEYGLEVNEYVDERLDCDKSTVAACKYFKRAYAKYKCWLTVAAAYNAGMGRISKSLETQDVEHALDLYLNKETSRYIFRLLAMKLIIENPARYGYAIKANQLYQPLDCDTFVVAEPVKDWVQWSKEHNITYSLLREYNPWIRSVSLPNPNNKTYVVKIPKETSLYRSKQTLKTYRENWTR